eukprot:355471-Chlamydomonas_euryale.AAC.2
MWVGAELPLLGRLLDLLDSKTSTWQQDTRRLHACEALSRTLMSGRGQKHDETTYSARTATSGMRDV